MRTVKFGKEVGDVSGLFYELIQRGYELLSISVHERCTYINLEDEEDKDPFVVAEDFLSKPAKSPSRSAMEERRQVYQKFLDEKPFRMENLRARFRVSQEVKAISREAQSREGYEAPVALLDEQRPEVLALPAAQKQGWIKKLLNLI